MGQFFTSWPSWAKIVFAFGCLAVMVLLTAWLKNRWVKRKLREYATIAARERRASQQDIGPSDDVPFGIRALESGIETPGIWISRRNTPDPASSQSLAPAQVIPRGDQSIDIEMQKGSRHQRWRSNPYTLRFAVNNTDVSQDADDLDITDAARQSSTSVNDGGSTGTSASLLPLNKSHEEGGNPSPTQDHRESRAAEIGRFGLARRNAVRVKSKGKQKASSAETSTEEASDLGLAHSQSPQLREESSHGKSDAETTSESPESMALPPTAYMGDVTPFTQFRQMASRSPSSRGYRPLDSDDALPIKTNTQVRGVALSAPSALRPVYLEAGMPPSPPPPPPSSQTVPRIVRARGTDFEMLQPRPPKTSPASAGPNKEKQQKKEAGPPIRLQDLTPQGRSQGASE